MKFKMQEKQNQLIQRISDQHLVVGIDIAQQIHVARSVNFSSKNLISFLKISNRLLKNLKAEIVLMLAHCP